MMATNVSLSTRTIHGNINCKVGLAELLMIAMEVSFLFIYFDQHGQPTRHPKRNYQSWKRPSNSYTEQSHFDPQL
jgi:hypothetical protein